MQIIVRTLEGIISEGVIIFLNFTTENGLAIGGKCESMQCVNDSYCVDTNVKSIVIKLVPILQQYI